MTKSLIGKPFILTALCWGSLFTISHANADKGRFDDVFIYQGRSGPVVLDRPLRQQANLRQITQTADPRPYATLIARVAEDQRLDPELLHAVIKVESDYQPQAVSVAGARGLMQLMPVIIREYGVTNAFDPQQNVRAGAQFLAYLLDKYGDLSLALAAYHAGETNVDRANGIPDITATRNYVARVTTHYQTQLAMR